MNVFVRVGRLPLRGQEGEEEVLREVEGIEQPLLFRSERSAARLRGA